MKPVIHLQLRIGTAIPDGREQSHVRLDQIRAIVEEYFEDFTFISATGRYENVSEDSAMVEVITAVDETSAKTVITLCQKTHSFTRKVLQKLRQKTVLAVIRVGRC